MTAEAITTDRERVAEALREYIDRGSWVENEEEQAEYQRLLAEYEDELPVWLPATRELHQHARDSRTGDSPPPVFVIARARLDQAAATREQAVNTMQALVRESYELGVPMAVLSRWSGYAPRWIQQILGKA